MKSRLFTTKFALSEIGTLADRFADWLVPGQVIAFFGELGAGKTTLIQALLKRHFGLEMASSPTFTISNEYSQVVHFDLYRLKDPEEFERMGWDEAFDKVALIEWPERLGERLPKKRIDVTLEHIDETRRSITVDAIG